MDSKFYDINLSYEQNYERGPIGVYKLKIPQFKKINPKFRFLGVDIDLPYGIAAGILLNAKFVKAAFDFGFSVSTYKTVRSDFFPCHPFPNVVYVDAPDKLDPLKTQSLKVKYTNENTEIKKISITNSFGVPSKNPKVWQNEVKKALGYEKENQLLILAFMGTVKKNQTQLEFITDFANASKLSKQTGAKVLEVNLSCPNIANEGLVCYDLKLTEKICRAIRKTIGNTPLIIKVGYYHNNKDVLTLTKIANEYANAIAAINTMQVEILDENGNQALPGTTRLRSGVAGHTIKWAGLEMVKKLNRIRQKRNYKFEIVGIGGIMTTNDYFKYRKAGADLVQSVTGAMWNPYLAYEIWQKENK